MEEINEGRKENIISFIRLYFTIPLPCLTRIKIIDARTVTYGDTILAIAYRLRGRRDCELHQDPSMDKQGEHRGTDGFQSSPSVYSSKI